MRDYEKLGAFYLGRRYDLEAGRVTSEPILYDAKDLTTHALCVGMTGSGKTGLGISLLEEAAIDGVPAIAIDPKGDLPNLLLTFPELSPDDFRPWIDEGEAARRGHTPDEEARATAELWRAGLTEWDQEPSRIARFEQAVERVIYTPGSSAGRPLSVLRSFAAPAPEVAADPDALRERTFAAVSGLLGLVGVAADPLRSREHVLLSTLLERAWREGRSLDLPTLIRQIQTPPVERLGVMEIDGFFPPADRFSLAMSLNNLIASPGFSAWTEGEPLDVGRLLYGESGRPRLSIVSIAHLSEPERMFVVTLLLGEIVAWMRGQPGSRSLRAILYMDEVFGYFPPTANPPSKTPMLTLLKQARAYGLGVVLATQNPVDLDYKGLSNAGTWFLGRLQTERDVARVIEGLEGASAASGASFDRRELERILAGLGSRVFLMRNVHEDAPVVFQTRWALSYLSGPVTREQIRQLAGEPPARADRAAPTSPAPEPVKRPVVPPGVVERFLPVTRKAPDGGTLLYRPALAAEANLHYARASAALDRWERVALLAPLSGDAGSPWEGAASAEGALPDLETEPEAGSAFAALPAAAAREASYARWKKQLAARLYQERPLSLYTSRAPRLVSRPGEREAEFRGRLRDLLREQRDLEVSKLQRRYAPRLAALQDRIQRAERRVQKESEQYRDQKLQTAISIGATVLGALFGRKLGSASNVGRATTAARGAGRAARERGDVARAEDRVEDLRQQLADLESRFEEDAAELERSASPDALAIEETCIAPRKSDLAVDPVLLAWTPWWVDRDGVAEPAYEL